MAVPEIRVRPLAWGAGITALVVAGVVLLWPDRAGEPAERSGEPSSTSSTTAEPAEDPSVSSTTSEVADLPGDPDRVPLDGFGEVAVRVRPAEDQSWLSWCLLAARTAAQRSQGLMTVTDLQGYSGMAFVYDEDVDNAFWMRNTPTPLSIAWVTAAGEVVSTADMAPCDDGPDCPRYPPGGSYRYAIEVFQGDLPALGITEGATVEVGGECAPRA